MFAQTRSSAAVFAPSWRLHAQLSGKDTFSDFPLSHRLSSSLPLLLQLILIFYNLFLQIEDGRG